MPQKKNSLYIFIISTILLSISCSSQKKLGIKAQQSYKAGEYAKAIDMYERLLEREDIKSKEAEYSFIIAECYRKINDSRKAERYYRRAIRRGYKVPIAKLRLADQYLKNGKIEDALVEYKEYKEIVDDDIRADNGIESCKNAQEWSENPTRYLVENMREFNTRENEFAPSYASTEYNLVYFTTSAGAEDKMVKKSEVSGMNFTDIMESRLDRQEKWSKPSFIEDTIINSPFDDGATTFNNEKTIMLYTFCKNEKGKQYGCQLYQTQKRGKDWGSPQKINIVHDSVSVGHPSMSANGLELYFSSRMQGGYGGADIWMVQRNSTSAPWSEPINLGPSINTPGDELYPFIRDDGNLYFSSDYWPGMGGLDIFRAIKDEEDVWIINNMKHPINSIHDDFGIVFQGKKEKGLFSSSRKEGRGGDDIYSFELPELKFFVEGKVIDKENKKSIADVPIILIGSDGTYSETKTKQNGTYSIQLKQYTDYIVLGSHEGFLKKKEKITTNNLTEDSTFNINFELISMSKPVEIPNIFYDFGKWTLNESSKDALIELALLLEDNPNITIELGAHTDMIGDSLSNMILSQRRANSIIEYLNEKGYDPDRLIAKGYGENMPVVANENLASQYTFISVGDVLSPNFINSFEEKETQEVLNQINRRTELKILSSNYIPKPEYFVRYKKKRLKIDN